MPNEMCYDLQPFIQCTIDNLSFCIFRLPYIPIFPSNRKQYSKKRRHFGLYKFKKIRIYIFPKQKGNIENRNMDIRK